MYLYEQTLIMTYRVWRSLDTHYTGVLHPKLVACPTLNVSAIAVPLPYMPRPAKESAARPRPRLNSLNHIRPENTPCSAN